MIRAHNQAADVVHGSQDSAPSLAFALERYLASFLLVAAKSVFSQRPRTLSENVLGDTPTEVLTRLARFDAAVAAPGR